MHFGCRVITRYSRFRLVAEHLELAAERIVREEAENAANIAYQLAPFQSGYLRESIRVTPGKTNRLSFKVEATAHYAVFVELGTVHSNAQPFLAPAIEAIRNNLVNRLLKLESELPAELLRAA